MTVVLAGRRPDPVGATTERFPIRSAVAVRERIRATLVDLHARHLVSSAACGADLLAINIAEDLGLGRTVVLPFPISHFRKTSVTDRPGEWGALYDRVVGEVDTARRLIVLDMVEDPDAAYRATTERLIDEAFGIGGGVVGVAVWEGRRPGSDETGHLLDLVLERGGSTREVMTVGV